jgi:hypothetical protein
MAWSEKQLAICPGCGYAMSGEWSKARRRARVICDRPLCSAPASGPWLPDMLDAVVAFRRSQMRAVSAARTRLTTGALCHE